MTNSPKPHKKRVTEDALHISPTPSGQTELKVEDFGASLREQRTQRGLSLNELSKLTGVPGATLSRIENNKMSPTLGVVLNILTGLGLDLTDLLKPKETELQQAELSVSRFKQGRKFELPVGDFIPLHGDFAQRNLTVHMTSIKPQPSDAEPELVGHIGEEFMCVLEGEMMLKVKGNAPVTLRPGDTAYFDSNLPHVYVALNNLPATGIIVYYNGHPPDSAQEMAFYQGKRNEPAE